MSAILEVKNLTKMYGANAAVNNVSFSVQRGEVVGFVGLNGAGKSTAINTMLGFLGASKGEVRLFDQKITTQNAWKSHSRTGFATGDMSLFDDMTGHQYHRFVAKLFGSSTKTELYSHLCGMFEPQLDKKIGTLSRGNRQKIALIAAFMNSPELVILDEPSSGLDPLMQQRFLSLIREQAEKGVTIFMSSHYLNEVVDVCSRILLIRQGIIVKDIPTSQLEIDAGKLVRVVTGAVVKLPKSAHLISEEKTADGRITEFVHDGAVADLQHWIAAIKGLRDMSIADHSREAMFEDLYEQETENV